MEPITNEQMIGIMRNALNCMDPRLVDHGFRVAYLIFKILHPQKRISDRELRDICILAMLHDIGAYKTEEIDKMADFETVHIWEHSIYGYLFLKHFSPLRNLAPVILYHHADCAGVRSLDPNRWDLAQMISLCDRADIFMHTVKDRHDFYTYIQKKRDILFSSDVIEQFMAADIDFSSLAADMRSDGEFRGLFSKPPFTEDEIRGYINMAIYSIDFRSSQTVRHTVTVIYASEVIARLLGASAEEIERIEIAAMLHDIGKIGTPVHILESNDRLSDSEMAIMKDHVSLTRSILKGNLDDDIVNMAANHHEKLDGSGYPRGLRNGEIAPYDRVVAVADIFSALCYARSYKEAFSKEKVTGILKSMSEKGQLDPHVVETVAERYDEIFEETNRLSRPVIEIYEHLTQEYETIRAEMERIYATASLTG